MDRDLALDLSNPQTTVHPKHETWICEEETNNIKCNTYNDVNDLMCRKCDYEVDGSTKVKAADKHEMIIGQLHSYEDSVAKWQYYNRLLNRGPIMEDAPGNNPAVNRGTTNGSSTNGGTTNGATNGTGTNGAATNGNHGRR